MRGKSRRRDKKPIVGESGEIVVADHISHSRHDDQTRLMAKILYLTGRYTYPQLADKTSISEGTIRNWARVEQWGLLRDEVRRLAARDAVKAARRTITNYFSLLDRRFEMVAQRMIERLQAENLELMVKERDILQFLLDTTYRQLVLARIAMQGAIGKELSLDPETLQLSRLDIPALPRSGSLSGALSGMWDGSMDDVLSTELEGVPEVIRSAVRFVLGVEDIEHLSPTLLVEVIEKKEELEQGEEDTDKDKTLIKPEDMI